VDTNQKHLDWMKSKGEEKKKIVIFIRSKTDVELMCVADSKNINGLRH
jgi:hypothetical protein